MGPEVAESFSSRLFDVGVARAQTDYLKSKVRICNQVAVFLIVLGLLYAGLSLLSFPSLAWLPGAASGLGVLAIVLNAKGFHAAPRLLMGTGPLYLCWLYHAYLVPRGEPMIVPLYMASCSFALYPWVLIDVRERRLLPSAVCICVFALVSQEWANQTFEAPVDGSLFRTNGMIWLTYGAASLIGSSCLYFFQRRNLDMERERDVALAQMTRDFEGEQSSRAAAEEKGAQLEARLQQAQKMEAIGRLAGGVAHDLNNLLTPILGFGELLSEELRQELPQHPDRVEFADGVLHAGFEARDLVAQLLAFGRQQTLSVQNLQLDDVIRDLKPLLRRTIREDIELDVALAGKLPPVAADRVQITQMLMNLVVNAQDAMADGGRVVIQTDLVELDDGYSDEHVDVAAGDYVTFCVSDDGPGIPPEVLPFVFEPFFTTKGNEGTGLGLATVFGIAKQHGGHVTIYSEVGHGTEVRVYLPLADGEVRLKRRTARPSVAGGTETILLVEDEQSVRRVTELALRRLGYDVLVAEDGLEALELIRSRRGSNEPPIRLLLSDVIMPKMNGRELHEAASNELPGLPRMFISGYTGDVVARQGVLLDGTVFLQKPFSIRQLSEKVREALES